MRKSPHFFTNNTTQAALLDEDSGPQQLPDDVAAPTPAPTAPAPTAPAPVPEPPLNRAIIAAKTVDPATLDRPRVRRRSYRLTRQAHAVHTLITLCTLGLWAPIYLTRWAAASRKFDAS